MERKIIETADGSKTLFLPEMDEQYHSVNGARTESEYVFLKQGFFHLENENPRIFEVGFGTGLNALLTAMEAEKQQRKTHFVSIEKYPVSAEEAQKLDYGNLISEEANALYQKIHQAAWNEDIEISEYFSIRKINDDLLTFDFTADEKFDLIYFDAFGPDKQSPMWQPEIFRKIYAACAPNAIFVTYSAKGEIRRQLAACGFTMERLPGPPGKRQMLRGTKE